MAHSSLVFCRRNPTADLLHKRQKIADTPVVRDLAVLDVHNVNRLEVDPPVSWSDPKKQPFMRAIVRFVSYDSSAIGKLPVDLLVAQNILDDQVAPIAQQGASSFAAGLT